MNPYDFVPINPQIPPQPRKPVWHNVLAPASASTAKLYSGYLYLYIKAMTPLFIRHGNQSEQSTRYPEESLANEEGYYILPGTSLKGMLRTVVETLCNGCMTVFRTPQEYTHNPLPSGFAPCQHNSELCIACRLFGMMQIGQRNAKVFLGKINIGDARTYDLDPPFHKPIHTAVLDTPKPRHRAFYLDANRYIAGRKFYFHHAGELRTESHLIKIRNKDEYRNQYIRPLDAGTDFDARIDFTNLEADELAALLLAITLQPDMRHKIGYGKPIGLGSIYIDITKLQLVDYSQRYKNFRAGRGITSYKDDDLADLLYQQLAPLDKHIAEAWQQFSAQPALQHLHRIWQWPPDSSVEYAYPSQSWFKNNPNARIAATRDLYPGD